jgi:urease accessory protein UreF
LSQVACDEEFDETGAVAETETVAARVEGTDDRRAQEREIGLRLREAVAAGELTPEQARAEFVQARLTGAPSTESEPLSEVDRFRMASRLEFQQFSSELQASIEAGELSSADAREELMELRAEMGERIRAIEADLALQ